LDDRGGIDTGRSQRALQSDRGIREKWIEEWGRKRSLRRIETTLIRKKANISEKKLRSLYSSQRHKHTKHAVEKSAERKMI